jgi:hypothetical protein
MKQVVMRAWAKGRTVMANQLGSRKAGVALQSANQSSVNGMSIMTRKEEEILRQLLRLAKGDPLLVERAFKECSRRRPEPDLKDIVVYIQQYAQANPRAA